MVEMIEAGEPAIMICHWPGMYCNGENTGFEIFQKAVVRTNAAYSDRIAWMKPSEIARYWAAKELTATAKSDRGRTIFDAPFAAKAFTVQVAGRLVEAPAFNMRRGDTQEFREVGSASELEPMTYLDEGDSATLCFDLPKGESRLRGFEFS